MSDGYERLQLIDTAQEILQRHDLIGDVVTSTPSDNTVAKVLGSIVTEQHNVDSVDPAYVGIVRLEGAVNRIATLLFVRRIFQGCNIPLPLTSQYLEGLSETANGDRNMSAWLTNVNFSRDGSERFSRLLGTEGLRIGGIVFPRIVDEYINLGIDSVVYKNEDIVRDPENEFVEHLRPPKRRFRRK